MKIHIITVVWGEEYINYFLKIVIPNQLSNGNLEIFKENPEAIYKIYTSSKDSIIIENSPILVVLSKCIKYEIIKIADIDFSSKYAAMNQLHGYAIDSAVKEQAVLIFLSPDMIISEFFFKKLMQLSQNSKVVLVLGFRVIKEEITPILVNNYSNNQNNKISISSRELANLSIKYMYPISQSLLINCKTFPGCPSHLYWNVDGSGILCRAFHLHPLLIKQNNDNKPINDTIDGTYIHKICYDYKDIFIVTDSDDLFIASVDSINDNGAYEKYDFNINKIAKWVCCTTNKYHRRYIYEKIRLHSDDISSRWNAVEADSDITVNEIMIEYNRIKNVEEFKKIIFPVIIFAIPVLSLILPAFFKKRFNKLLNLYRSRT